MPPGSGNRLAVGQHTPPIRRRQTGHDVKQRGFPAAARAEQANKLSSLDIQGDIVERVNGGPTRPEPLRDAFDRKFSRTRIQRHGPRTI
jgi:hypothetical protein